MAKKRKPDDSPRQCVTCGKTLPAGVRWCVSCGTHDEAELDARVAGLDAQIERSRERNRMLLFLSRLTFGLWRI
jgi:hypothetical protein